jgi:hypothetical protein
VAGVQPQNEALVLRTLEVIWQHYLDESETFDSHPRSPCLVEALHGAIERNSDNIVSWLSPSVEKGNSQQAKCYPDLRGLAHHGSYIISSIAEPPLGKALQLTGHSLLQSSLVAFDSGHWQSSVVRSRRPAAERPVCWAAAERIPMSDRKFEGGCLCASTRFRASGTATSRCYCHCNSCRLAFGAPFVAWATFPAAEFRLIRGELTQYQSSEGVLRGFCALCGTGMTYSHQGRIGQIDVAVATLDDPGSLQPEYHIWVSHKLSWVSLGDQLPQFAEWRASEGQA